MASSTPGIAFKKVSALPTSGMAKGDIYFVSGTNDTNEIYLYNGTGWEKYSQPVKIIDLTA